MMVDVKEGTQTVYNRIGSSDLKERKRSGVAVFKSRRDVIQWW